MINPQLLKKYEKIYFSTFEKLNLLKEDNLTTADLRSLDVLEKMTRCSNALYVEAFQFLNDNFELDHTDFCEDDYNVLKHILRKEPTADLVKFLKNFGITKYHILDATKPEYGVYDSVNDIDPRLDNMILLRAVKRHPKIIKVLKNDYEFSDYDFKTLIIDAILNNTDQDATLLNIIFYKYKITPELGYKDLYQIEANITHDRHVNANILIFISIHAKAWFTNLDERFKSLKDIAKDINLNEIFHWTANECRVNDVLSSIYINDLDKFKNIIDHYSINYAKEVFITKKILIQIVKNDRLDFLKHLHEKLNLTENDLYQENDKSFFYNSYLFSACENIQFLIYTNVKIGLKTVAANHYYLMLDHASNQPHIFKYIHKNFKPIGEKRNLALKAKRSLLASSPLSIVEYMHKNMGMTLRDIKANNYEVLSFALAENRLQNIIYFFKKMGLKTTEEVREIIMDSVADPLTIMYIQRNF